MKPTAGGDEAGDRASERSRSRKPPQDPSAPLPRPSPSGPTSAPATQAKRAPQAASAPPILTVSNLAVAYNESVLALRGVGLAVPTGSIVALLGANGAGKTTLLRAVSGLLALHGGSVRQGSVTFDGSPVEQGSPAAVVRRGMAQVMEGRRIFGELSVDENLRAGAFTRRDRAGIREAYDRVIRMFPVLAERRRSQAGLLSGGEQQMLAIGRALMADPRLLLLDEPSLGLAPLVVQQISGVIAEINRQGTSVLLVEQNANMALGLAHHGYVLETGRVARSGSADELRADADIQEYYLGAGTGGGERRSFRDLKGYRRRSRWSA